MTFPYEILALGLALAIDAAVVCFALGLIHLDLHVRKKWERGLLLSGIFGFFQFIMLWLGSYGGFLFTFSAYGHYFQLIVAGVFILIGLKFFQESLGDEKRDLHWGFVSICLLAIATSIDALAAGVSFGTLPNASTAALEVGLITFAVCGLFYTLSQFLTQIPEKWLFRIGSLVFLYLGGEIIWGYIQKGYL